MSAKVILHIDRLVLRGISAGDRDAVVHALRETLSRSLAAPGIGTRLTALGHVAHVRVPAFTIARGAQPRAIGRAAAEGIVGSLRR
jgi:hypothetical protein